MVEQSTHNRLENVQIIPGLPFFLSKKGFSMKVLVSPSMSLFAPTPEEIQNNAKTLIKDREREYNDHASSGKTIWMADEDAKFQKTVDQIKEDVLKSKTLEGIPCVVFCKDKKKMMQLVVDAKSLGGSFEEYERWLRDKQWKKMRTCFRPKPGEYGISNKFIGMETESEITVLILADDKIPNDSFLYKISTMMSSSSIPILESEFRTMF